jgi:hypothetical protein
MKNSVLYFSLFVLLGFSVKAQNLVISDTNGVVYNNGDTITVTTTLTGTNYLYLHVLNSGIDSLSVKAKKKEISIVSGSANTFCWGLVCFDPVVIVSPVAIWIAPDSISNTFDAQYKANNHIGISILLYTFFDENNIADSSSVFVKFDGLHSNVPEIVPEKVLFSNASPNPANGYSNISYALPGNGFENRIVVRDMIGNDVYNELLVENSGTIKIDTYSLSNGVYFYTLIVNGKPYATRKLIIKH